MNKEIKAIKAKMHKALRSIGYDKAMAKKMTDELISTVLELDKEKMVSAFNLMDVKKSRKH